MHSALRALIGDGLAAVPFQFEAVVMCGDNGDEIDVTTCIDEHRVFLNLTNGTRRTEPFDPSDIDARYIGEKDTNLG